jgi:hypothetical protein
LVGSTSVLSEKTQQQILPLLPFKPSSIFHCHLSYDRLIRQLYSAPRLLSFHLVSLLYFHHILPP